MRTNWKHAFFAGVLVVLVTGFLEVTLRVLAFMSPRVNAILESPWTLPPEVISPTVPDERLGSRPNPAVPGHDHKGFRNPTIPTNPYVVALGDSQTYGEGVDAQDAWPRQLESMIGKSVYSMAWGGYGPTHSLILMDEVVALRPKIIIEAFYTGNDLFDSFNHVYNVGQLRELKDSDPHVQASIREAEQAETLVARVGRMYSMPTNRPVVDKEPTKAAVTSDRFFPLAFLSQNSKIYGLLRRVKYKVSPLLTPHEDREMVKARNAAKEWETAQEFAKEHLEYCEVYNDGRFKTVFTSPYRLVAVDLGDPRIAEGLQISLKAINRMHEIAVANRARFLVLLIPTKETVFRELRQDAPAIYRKETDYEERVLNTTKDFLAHNDIEYLDSLPALREELAAGIQLYPVSYDGHPIRQGYKPIATLIAERLKKNPRLSGWQR